MAEDPVTDLIAKYGIERAADALAIHVEENGHSKFSERLAEALIDPGEPAVVTEYELMPKDEE